jgi:hypothetical protein
MADVHRATRWRSADEPCLNCGDPTIGRYCPSCGQRKVAILVSVRTIIADVLEDQFLINRALPRTVASLLLHPGFLNGEYVRGRIVRYIAPFKLYLVTSVLFFLVISFISLRALERVDFEGSGAIMDADSARAELVERRSTLLETDTVPLSPGQRGMLRQELTNVVTALAMLDDTLAGRDDRTLRRVARIAGGDAALPPGVMQPWAQQVRFASSVPLQAALDRKLAQIGHLPRQDAFRTIVSDMLEYAPHMVFLLLPVFALLLKLLYIRRSRFYAEHFVFALHVHSFFFLMFFLMNVTPGSVVDRLLIFWMVAYVWLAMKRVYGQGWFRTSVKWWVLGVSYSIALALGLAGLTVATLLLT